MKQSYSISGLITAISLLLCVIWLNPVFAAEAPTFVSLGQIAPTELQVPGAMDLDEAGNLYVADARGGRVHKFSPYGDLEQSFKVQATGRGLAVSPDGTRLYVSRQQSVVIVNVADGEIVDSLTGANIDTHEFGVAGEIDLDAFGNVFVADEADTLVRAYDASGQYVTSFGGLGDADGQFMQIGGMSINSSGQVVVADSAALNNKVHVFTLNADLSVASVVAYSNQEATVFGSPAMYVPRGLTFDAQGRGYFLEYRASQVRVVSESFGYLGAYTQSGYEADQLNNVADAIFDNVNSRLFVGCDTGRIVILGVGPDGKNPEVNNVPTDATPQSPAGGSVVGSVSPVLVINNATDPNGDALTYTVIVSQEDKIVFQAVVPADAGDTTDVAVDVALEENKSFSWTVQASDGKESSALSVPTGFFVNAEEQAPTAPELSVPLKGEKITGQEALVWGDSTDPDPNGSQILYHVEIALDEAFTQVVAKESLAETSLTLNSLTAYRDLVGGLDYFWRVTAEDNSQLLSLSSNTGWFVYETTGLTITANMPGAVVSFSGNHAYAGQTIGVAPVELRDLAPGPLSVVVERSGFEPFVAQITMAEGESVDLYAELSPAMVVNDLSVSTNGVKGRTGLFVEGNAVPFVVDFDNDGDLDLLVGDASGQITLFSNMRLTDRYRKIRLDNGVSLGLPVMPQAVPFVADWNNDGRKDLIVGQADGSVKLFINVGLEEAPAFAAGIDMPTVNGVLTAGSNAAPAVVDYDGDGAKDLLVGNAAGEVLVFLNQSADATPLLAAPFTVLQVNSAAVPLPVDWDADGQKELMVTINGAVKIFAKVDGEYQKIKVFKNKKRTFTAAFPIDFNGKGKKLLVGKSNGKVVYLFGKSKDPVASFQLALQEKVDELGGFVADEAPELLADVAMIGTLIEAGDYASAELNANDLSLHLIAGAAQTSAIELANLCK